jgi:uncharacterized coiled-coil protein SlyX
MERVLFNPADELKRVQSVCAWQETEIEGLRRQVAELEAELDALDRKTRLTDPLDE